MQADAACVGQRDAGEGGMVAPAEQGQQFAVERAADSPARVRGIDVDRDVARGVVGRAIAMRRAIGVARNHPVGFGDQPPVALPVALHPPPHFHSVGCVELETDPVVGHERPVDRRAAGGVAGGIGRADQHDLRCRRGRRAIPAGQNRAG